MAIAKAEIEAEALAEQKNAALNGNGNGSIRMESQSNNAYAPTARADQGSYAAAPVGEEQYGHAAPPPVPPRFKY